MKMIKVLAIAAAMMMSLSMFTACSSNTTTTEETTTTTETTTTETTTTETTTEATEEKTAPEAIDLNALAEEVKAASAAVSEVVFTETEEGITVDVKMSAEATEDDVNAANDVLVAALKAENAVAANLFQNTEEKCEKAYSINYYVGEEVAYTAGAGYSAGPGRKGMVYVCNVAWSGPEAVAAE